MLPDFSEGRRHFYDGRADDLLVVEESAGQERKGANTSSCVSAIYTSTAKTFEYWSRRLHVAVTSVGSSPVGRPRRGCSFFAKSKNFGKVDLSPKGHPENRRIRA